MAAAREGRQGEATAGGTTPREGGKALARESKGASTGAGDKGGEHRKPQATAAAREGGARETGAADTARGEHGKGEATAATRDKGAGTTAVGTKGERRKAGATAVARVDRHTDAAAAGIT